MNKPRRSLGTAYVGLFLALLTIVGVLSPIGGPVLVILLGVLVYFVWGMNSKIKELERRLAQQPQQ